MPTLDETFAAKFEKAHAAGDEEGMKALKEAYKQLKARESGGTTPPASAANSPQPKPGGDTLNRSLGSRAAEVGGSAVGGGVAGYFAPEIMGAAGTGLKLAAPFTGPAAGVVSTAGAALQSGGAALKSSRLSSAVAGAVTSAVGNVAGQTAEKAGAGPKTRFAVEFLASGGAPLLVATGKYVVGTPLKAAWNAVTKLTGSGEGEAVSKAVQTAQRALASPGVAAQPQIALHETLAKGVAADLQAADAAAKDLLQKAHEKAALLAKSDTTAAQRVVEDAANEAKRLKSAARQRADVMQKAAKADLAKAERVKALADYELQGVGKAAEPSDIGKALQGKVSQGQQQLIRQREAQYQVLKTERDAVVQAKEANGQFLDAEPAMKALKQELSTKLLATKAGREAAQGKALVTEQGTMSAYQKVYDAIANRRVQTGVNEAGNPTFQTFKTTFEALDHVRRKLGDVGWGKATEEGYGALGQGIARDLYGKISKIQQDFVGGDLQKQLQSVYKEGSERLEKFAEKGAQKLTAVDRINPESFLADPASIPSSYFRSQRGVQDLVELTGDPKMVAEAAGSYAARELEGKSAKQVGEWLRKQSDWVREVPGLQGKVESYAEKLGKIERVGEKLEGRAGERVKEAGRVRSVAEIAAEKLQEGAPKQAKLTVEGLQKERDVMLKGVEAEAKEVRAAAQERAKGIVKEGFPAEATRKLLLTGSPEELKEATRYLAGSPGGKEALRGSVRNVLATLPPTKLEAVWHERMMPMLREGGLLPKKDLAKLEVDVQRVLLAHSGKEALTAVQRVVRAALAQAAGGEVGGVAGRALQGVRGGEGN